MMFIDLDKWNYCSTGHFIGCEIKVGERYNDIIMGNEPKFYYIRVKGYDDIISLSSAAIYAHKAMTVHNKSYEELVLNNLYYYHPHFKDQHLSIKRECNLFNDAELSYDI